MQFPLHAEPAADARLEGAAYGVFVDIEFGEIPFDAHEKSMVLEIDMLIERKYVAVVFENKIRDRYNDARLVHAVDQENSGFRTGFVHTVIIISAGGIHSIKVSMSPGFCLAALFGIATPI